MMIWKLLITITFAGDTQHVALVISMLPTIPRAACWLQRIQVVGVQSWNRGSVSMAKMPMTEMTRPPTAKQNTSTE